MVRDIYLRPSESLPIRLLVLSRMFCSTTRTQNLTHEPLDADLRWRRRIHRTYNGGLGRRPRCPSQRSVIGDWTLHSSGSLCMGRSKQENQGPVKIPRRTNFTDLPVTSGADRYRRPD